MTAVVCEICGNPALIHLTEVDQPSGAKPARHFCSAHAPQQFVPGAADELKMIEQLIARVDASDWSAEQKAEHRAELRKLAEDIAAGRRQLFGGAD